jgi:plastocyanin
VEFRTVGVVALILVAALFAACSDGDGNRSATPAGDAGDADLVELELIAADTQFDKDRLEAPAGSEVAVTLDNRDSTEHNFSLYESVDAADPLSEGPLLPGPAFLTYQFTAPEAPGTYHFQCDVHPDAMNGQFVAE